MKKSLIALMLITAFTFSGCTLFGGDEQKELKQSADENTTGAIIEDGGKTPVANVDEKLPTFEDGDVYLKALTDKNPELCKEIKNADLKTRCAKEVKVPEVTKQGEI